MRTKTNSRPSSRTNRLTSRTWQRAALNLAALFCFAGLSSFASAQLSGTKNIPGDYATLAAAITDLNAQGVGTGGVILNMTTGETAPAGGYSIGGAGSPLLTSTSAAKPVTIQGNGNTITANAGLTVGNLNDAIFKIVGADFITIVGFVMQENPANVVNTPAASNNMTEWGVALLYATATDGATNNFIQNNTISLSRTYANTFGVYSNVRHADATPTTTADITAASGANSNNKVYANTISNVNLPICFVGSTTVAFMDQGNDIGGTTAGTANVITNWGGAASLSSYVSVSATIFGIYANNQIGVNVSRNSLTSAALGSATTTRGIFLDYTGTSPTGTFTNSINNNTVTITNTVSSTFEMIRSQGIGTLNTPTTININNNSILNCATPGSFIGIVNSSLPGVLTMNANTVRGTSLSGTTSAFTGVSNTGAASSSISLSNNNIGDGTGGAVTFTVASSGALLGVTNSGGAATANLTMNANNIQGIVHSVAGTSAHTYVINTSATLSQAINNNTFTNLNVNTTGTTIFIQNNVSLSATGTKNVNGNSIVTAYSRTGATGAVTLVSDTGASTSPSTSSFTNNNFSNVTVAGTTTLTGFSVTDGSSVKTVTGNTLSTWIAATGAISGMSFSSWNLVSSFSNNSLTGITGQSTITGVTIGSTINTATPLTISNNTISALSSTGTGGSVTGLTCGNTSATVNISGNTISSLSSTGASSTVLGLAITSATNTTVSGNTINTLSGSGATSPVATGLSVSAGTTVNVSKNKIYDISQSGAISTTSPAVNGMLISAGTTVNVSNNLIGDLRTPAASLTDAIRGISITSVAATTSYNVYYNTVFINAASTGANFGTTGLFHTVSTVATTAKLDLRNSIIDNRSTPNGTGLTAVLRRSAGAASNLANYASTSNNNDLFLGVAGANKFIYSDGTSTASTIAAYKAGVFTAGTIAPRDSNSFSDPTYLSTSGGNVNFLHIDPTVATGCESGGAPISGFTDDFDGQARNANFPDVGADEFTGIILDTTAPAISYTALANTSLTGNRTLTATILDPSGVPTAGVGLPVLYWKINAGSYTAATAASLGSGQYQFTFGSGVSAGDTVSYYIVAQDSAATPNVGSNPSAGASGFTANPPAAATPPTTPSSYTIVAALAGSINVGTTETITSITNAGGLFATINGSVLTGNLIVNITSDLTAETGAVALNQFAEDGGGAGTYTITIQPSGAARTISGAAASTALVRLNGANRVIVNGSIGGAGTDRSLTISNTSATAPTTVLFGSIGTTPIVNDTLKNCVIINGVNTSSAVVIEDVGLVNAGFFNNITIQNNSVQKAFRGILAVAATSGTNGSGTLITQNDLNTAGANSIRLNPIAVQGTNGVTITNNNMGNISDANAEVPVGILLATGVDNAVVTGNTISGITTTNTTSSAAVSGVLVSVGANSTSINVSNNTISTLTSSGTALSFYAIGSFSPNCTFSNNIISGLTNTGASTHWGIVISGASGSIISGNTISGMSSSTAGVPVGINPQGATGNVTVSSNTISNLTSSVGTAGICGILLSGTLDNITVQNNKVTGIFNSNTGTFGARGIRVAGGNGHTIVNNFVSDVKMDMTGGAAFSIGFSVHGITIEAGKNHKVYHNSVNLFGLLPGTATSSILTSAFAISSNLSTGCDVRNNIFSNTITGGTTSIAHVSTFLPTSAASSMNLTWNNNAMYTGTTAGVHGVCHAGTTYTSPPSGPSTYAGLYPVGSFVPSSNTGVSNLRSYTSTLGNANNDNASFAATGAAPFTSNTDLHINTGVSSTPLESGGASAGSTGVTVDIDGQVRPGPAGSVNGGATAPDIGADEFDGVPLFANDMQATAFITPTNGGSVVANSAFSPQASFTNNGTATQTNVTVRYRICTDGSCSTVLYNQTATIASIAQSVTTTVTFPSTMVGAGTFAMKAKAELAGDQVTANDEISGTFTAEAPLSGSYNVGSGGNYPTLTQAVAKLNSLGVSGPVVLNLIDASYNRPNSPDATESYPIILNAIPGASATNTVTIKPASGNTPTMTGSSASALIVLNGADFVTIDGSNNGTSSKDLTMTNTNTGTSSAVIWLQTAGADGATNNTVKNVNLVGNSNTTTLVGVGAGGSTISITSLGTGNNNNTFQNNSITKTQFGIYSAGASAANKNTGTVITGNLINGVSPNNVQIGGILVKFDNGVQITNNNIANISQSSGAFGIGLGLGDSITNLLNITSGSDVINAVVSKNKIDSVTSTSSTGFTAAGIIINPVTSGTTRVDNNMISRVVSQATPSDSTFGIFAMGGTGSTTQIYFNSISMTGSRVAATNPSYALAIGGSNPIVDVRSNIFLNTQTGTSTGKMYAIGTASSTFSNMTSNYNDFFVSGTNTFVGQSGGLGTAGTDRATLAAWIAATGVDTPNSISADPTFVSASNVHLQTSPIPPVSRAGVTIAGITTDFDGDSRQSPPDQGADEITTYILTYTAGANGSLTGTTPQEVLSGGSGTAVTAVPNACYHFVNWSDGSTANPRTDTNVIADNSVTANFAINTYTLTYTAGPNGSVTGTSPQTVNCGDSGTAVTAVPNACYHFVNWSDGSTANPRTDSNVNADISVTANFAINTYTLTYTAGPNGSVTGTSPQTVNCGDSGTAVTAVPNACYHFVNWSDGSTANPRTDTNVNADITVTANFAINTYTLTYTAGPNGSVTGTSPQTVNCGDSGTAVTAVPNACYHFVNWSDGSTANPRTDSNVMSNVTVTANFAINTYTLTYTAGPNGTVTGTSPQTVNCGDSGTAVTAVPNACYHFVNWSDGSTANPRTDSNVNADVTVTANFAINTYTLTYTAGPNGSITGTSPQTVNCGDSGTAVTAVPNSGYHFVNWSDASTQNPRTDTNVMANITVTANFALNASTNADLSNLTATAGPLSPPFDSNTLSYTINVPFTTTSTTVTPTASDANATITVNGNPVASGTPSGSIPLNVGNNIITVVVTAQDTTTMKTYTINVIRGGAVVVSGSTGADGNYATLGAAFAAINANGTQGGNTIGVSIIADTNETASAVLNQPATSSWTSLTVTPSGARTVSGSLAAPLVDLAGADNVTINGLNASGNSLVISNTSTAATAGTSTIRFINGATNNTVQNCTIAGSSTASITTAGGNVLFSTSTVAGGNSNNTITANNIGPAGVNLPTKGVMGLGSASPNANSGNMITSNNVFDFFNAATSVAGIDLQGNNATGTISNNRIYQTASRTFTGAAGITYSGILVNNTGTFTVSNNVIGFGAANGTGTTTITGTGTGLGNQFRGISFVSSNTTTFSTISGNTVSGINQTTNRTSTTTDNAGFIAIQSGSSAADAPANMTGNTIGSLDGSSTIVINDGATASTAPLQGILDFDFQDALTIANNNIGSITLQQAAGVGTTAGFRGILVAGTAATTHAVTNNTVGGTAAGSISNNIVGSNSVYGIQAAATNLNASGNLVRNLSSNSNGAGLIVTCGIIFGTSSTGVNTVSRNVVHSLSNNSAAASNAVRGIQCTVPLTANVIERNFVHSLSMTATVTTGSVDGIVHGSTGSATYKNNMVRLGVDSAGASITTGIGFNGMLEQAGTNNYYFNSVYVGGSGVAAVANTFAFSSAVVTNARNYKDNIFWNARSNASGGGKNYAITVGGTTPNPAGLASDYNDLYASGTGGFVGLFNATDQLTLANWRTATGQDANSISADPSFVNPVGTATSPATPEAVVDLHITCASPADGAATPIAGVANDFDNDTRNLTTPDIGADEINLNAPALVSAVSRKVHGAAGPFDITLPGVECRNGGASGVYQMVFTFAAPVNVASASVSSGTGSVSMASGNGTNTITVDLTGVANAQYLTVKLLCVDDGSNVGTVSATMGVLIGDTTANGSVNNSDVGQVKVNVGSPVDGTNFRTDVTASGDINASDVNLTKIKSGTALPP
jgi:hypothetical protein